jgi:nucleoside-diphosphate-sugar epimerase
MTYSKDAARFIERLLEDGDWPEYSIISGSDTSFTQILALAQEYTGKYRRELQKENKRMTSPQVKILA